MYRGLMSALAGAALTISSAPASAIGRPAIESGNDLLAACRASETSGYCYGYVLGIFRGITTYDAVKQRKSFCNAENATVEQLVLLVQQYLLAHPKEMSQASEIGVILAFLDAFPCPKT